MTSFDLRCRSINFLNALTHCIIF